MEPAHVTHLTRGLIARVNEESGHKIRGVAQFLLHNTKTLKEKKLESARLSDGSFYADFLIYPNIKSQFLETVRSFDVLEVGLLKKEQNSSFMLLFEFKVVRSPVEGGAGCPVEYFPGATNDNGTEDIPVRSNVPTKENEEAAAVASTRPAPPAVNLPIQSSSGRARGPEEGAGEVQYTEIANLNMYDRSWTIRGRIVKKSELKRFKSANREGSVFNVVIKDETRAIQGSFFNEMASRFFGALREGGMYAFSDGEIKIAGRFNCTDNKYEINFNEKCAIREVANDTAIASFHFNLVPIEEISKKNENEVFDVLAIVEDPGTIKEVNLKNGSATDKKTLGLVDHTGYKVDLTIWGQAAHECTLEADAIAIFQDVRVKDYNGKSLSFSMGSRIVAKVPDSAQYRALVLYRNSRNCSGQNYRSLTEPMNLAKMRLFKIAQLAKESHLLIDDQDNTKLYFTVIAHIMRVVNALYYDSCPNDACMKKLAPALGPRVCEKCHRGFERPKPRFMAAFKFADDTGVVNVMCSGEEYSHLIFNCPTERLRELKEINENELNEFVKDHLFTEFKVRLLAKKDFYNNEPKVKFQAIKVSPVAKNLEYISESYVEMVGPPAPQSS